MKPDTAAPAAPRPAATLILLRDGADGPEVLMLKRHGLSDAFGEAFVFPGGKVDTADAAIDAAALLDEAPAALQARLAERDADAATAVGLFVAAIREACEEAGILLGHGPGGATDDEAMAALRAGAAFGPTLARFGLRLRTSELIPWARWITPVWRQQAKRYDTRFFVARMPPDAVASHDGREATESAWLRPRAALERYWAREIALAPPQIMTLAHFARHASVAGILDEARSRPPFLVQPEVVEGEAGAVICFPGDPAHPVRAPAMPGPPRLAARNGRYEPEEGFDAFFA